MAVTAAPGDPAPVFLSYSRHDAAFAARLHHALERFGISPWIDREEIRHGDTFWHNIQDAIDEAIAFIYIISPFSVAGDSYCLKELAYAKEHHKRLLPVVHQDVSPDVPDRLDPALAGIDFVFLRENDNFEGEVQGLVEAINRLPEWHREHSRLLLQAQAWTHNRDDRSLLLRGQQLRQAENWLRQADNRYQVPTPIELEFIQASQTEERAQSRRRLQVTSTVSVVLLALAAAAAVLGLLANYQRGLAEEQQNIAQARAEAAEGSELAAERPNQLLTATLLATQSLQRMPSLPASTTVRQGTALLRSASRSLAPLPGTLSPYAYPMTTPDGRTVLASHANGVMVRDIQTGRTWLAAGKQSLPPALSPAGHFLVTYYAAPGGNADLVRLWDLSRRRTVPLGPVTSLSFAPDDSAAAGVNQQGQVQVWDTRGWRNLVHGPGAYAVVSPGAGLAAVETAGVVTVFSRASNWHQVGQFAAGNGNYVHFDSSGRYLYSTGSNYTPTLIWDGNRHWAQVASLPEPAAPGAFAWSPDGHFLARADDAAGTDAGDRPSQISIWDTRTWKRSAIIRQAASGCTLAFSPDGISLVTACEDGIARVWDLRGTPHETARLIPPDFSGQALAPLDAAFRSNGTVVTASSDGSAAVFPLAARPTGSARSFPVGLGEAIDPSGRYVIGSDAHYTLRVHDLARGATVYRYSTLHTATGFSSRGSQVLILTGPENGDGPYHLSLWHGGKLIALPVLRGLPNPDLVPSSSLAFDPGAHLLAIRGNPGTVWQRGGGWRRVLTVPGGYVDALALSANGRYFAAASRTREDAGVDTVRVWKVAGWQILARSSVPFIVHSLVFGRDSRTLLGGGDANPDCAPANSGWLYQWNGNAGWRLQQTLVLDQSICALAIGPDGSQVAAAMADATIRLWDASWNEVDRITGVQSYELGYSADSRYLVTLTSHFVGSGSRDQAQLWLVQPRDLVQTVCRRVDRNLTRQEWKLYVGSSPYRQTCPNLPAS